MKAGPLPDLKIVGRQNSASLIFDWPNLDQEFLITDATNCTPTQISCVWECLSQVEMGQTNKQATVSPTNNQSFIQPTPPVTTTCYCHYYCYCCCQQQLPTPTTNTNHLSHESRAPHRPTTSTHHPHFNYSHSTFYFRIAIARCLVQ